MDECHHVSASYFDVTPLFSQKVFPRFTGFQFPKEAAASPAIQDIFRELWNNGERNSLIVRDILNAHNEGRECLVLSERLEHLDILKTALQDKVPHLYINEVEY